MDYMTFCLGYHKWKIVIEQMKFPIFLKHKCVGNLNAFFNFTSEVPEYLSEISHNCGESQAACFVRELTGIEVRNI